MNFKYEVIPTFCFICRLIGHGEKFCYRIFETPLEDIENPYGAWLRADPRQKAHNMGAKWLRNGGNFQSRNSGERTRDDEDKERAESMGQTQQTRTKSGIIVQVNRADKGENSGTLNDNRQADKYQSNIHILKLFQEGNTSGLNTLDVLDPKRRRMTMDHDKILSTAQD